MGSNCAQSQSQRIDVSHIEQADTQQQRPESPTITLPGMRQIQGT